MNRVWDHSKQSGNGLLLMIALADQANDQGLCWPSIGTLARKTRLSERTVQTLLHGSVARPGVPARVGLVDTDELEVLEGGGRGRSSTYRLTVRDSHPSEKGDGVPELENGARNAPIQKGAENHEKGASRAERVRENAERVQHVAPEPVLTVKRTGENRKAAAPRARAQGSSDSNETTAFADGEQLTITSVGSILTPIGLHGDPRFWRKIIDTYGGLDLEGEALKMASWQRDHRKRQCSQRFVLNWLDKSIRREQPSETNRSRVAPTEDERFTVFRKYA